MIDIIQVAQEDLKKGLIVNADNTVDVEFEGNGIKDSASRSDHVHNYSDIVGAPSFGDAPITYGAIQDGVGLSLTVREGKDVIDVKTGSNGIIINELGEVDLDNEKVSKGGDTMIGVLNVPAIRGIETAIGESGQQTSLSSESVYSMMWRRNNDSTKADSFIGIDGTGATNLKYRFDSGAGDGGYIEGRVYHENFKPTPSDINAVNKNGDFMKGNLNMGENVLTFGGIDAGDIVFHGATSSIEKGRIFTRANADDSAIFISGSSVPSQDVVVENGNLGIRLDCVANSYVSYHNESGHMSFGSAKTSGIDAYLGGIGANWFSDSSVCGFWRDGGTGVGWWGVAHNGIRKVHYSTGRSQFYVDGRMEVSNNGLGGWWDADGCSFLQNSRPWVGGGNLAKLITGIVNSPSASENLHYGIGFQNQDVCIYTASPQDSKINAIRMNHVSSSTTFPGSIHATNILGTYEMITEELKNPKEETDIEKLRHDLYRVECNNYQLLKLDYEDFGTLSEEEFNSCKDYMIAINPNNKAVILSVIQRPSIFDRYK